MSSAGLESRYVWQVELGGCQGWLGFSHGKVDGGAWCDMIDLKEGCSWHEVVVDGTRVRNGSVLLSCWVNGLGWAVVDGSSSYLTVVRRNYCSNQWHGPSGIPTFVLNTPIRDVVGPCFFVFVHCLFVFSFFAVIASSNAIFMHPSISSTSSA